MLYLALISIVTFIAGFLIIAVKLIYPYHFIIGILLMILSMAAFVFSVRTYFKVLKSLEALNTLQAFLLQYRHYIYVLLAIVLIVITVMLIIPLTKNPFKDMSPDEVHEQILRDLDSSSVILDHLEITGNKLTESGLLEKKEFSADERELVKSDWHHFVMATIEADYMTDTYRFFHFVPAISQPEDHAKAFTIAYSLYVKKNEIISRIIAQVQPNETAKKILNEKLSELEISNAYKVMAEHYYLPKTIISINAGRGYLNAGIEKYYGKNIEDNRFIALKENAKNDYDSLKERLGATVINSAKVGSEKIEKGLFRIWFPVQKNAAKALGHTYLSKRDYKFITLEQIAEIKKEMQPGDIMLQRRNWYASNIGIPGFWAHAALYTGTLEEMDTYFADEFPYEGSMSLSEYLEKKLPEVYAKFGEPVDGHAMTVIEGKEPGIILQSMEISANADYLAVLRPKLSKSDKLLALLRAFKNYGKPYDFNFDFETRDSMVCSELVYDAYQAQEGKAGINFPLSSMNGRTIMAPVDIARKFRDEFKSDKAEFDFVTFLDGNEKTKTAIKKEAEDFIATLDRPKYSFLLD